MDIRDRKTLQSIDSSLQSIAKSLSTLAEDTKANKELREQNREMFSQLENRLIDLADDPFGFNTIKSSKHKLPSDW